MKKPEVILENYKQVYDYYEEYQQPKAGARLGHSVMSWMFRPQVEYSQGAKEASLDLLKDPNKRTIIAINHLSDNDQYVVASMAHREQSFRQMIGNTFVQAKEPLFHHPNKIIRPLLRRGVDVMGAVPAFRKKDVTEDQEQLRHDATARLLDISVNKLQRGMHMAIFPEGTRNKDNPDKVQELRPGVAIVAGRVATACEVGIIPVGFTYEGDKRHPKMWVGEPILDSDFSADTFLPFLRDSLQDAVNNARENLK